MLEDSEEVNNSAPDTEEPVQPPRATIDKNQKIFLVILLLVAILMIGLWAVQLRQGITGPFKPRGNGQGAATTNESPEAAAEKSDTDQDGLVDAQESNIYKTSPYLEDTDGDGIKDGEEIKKGTDPNCPEGKVCGGESVDNNSAAVATSSILNSGNSPATATSPAPAKVSLPQGLSEQQMKNMLEGKMDAATLRQALLNSGADPKLLEQLSDEELIKSYQKSLGSLGGQ